MSQGKFGGMIAVALFALLSACSGPNVQVQVSRSQPRMPVWARGEIPEPDGWIYLLGTAESVSSLDEGRKQARRAALAEATSYVGTIVRQDSRDGQQEDSIKLQAEALISKVEQDDIYTERIRRFDNGILTELWNVYLLLRVPRLVLDAERKRKENQASEQVQQALILSSEATKLIQRREYASALTKAAKAEKLAARAGQGAGKERAQIEQVLDQARRHATSVAVLADAEHPEIASALKDGIEAKLTAAGLRPVGLRRHPPDGDFIQQIAAGGRARLKALVEPKTAQVVVAFQSLERTGSLFGKRSAWVRVKVVVIEPASGERLLSLAESARGFGADVLQAQIHAAGEVAGKIARAVAKRVLPDKK